MEIPRERTRRHLQAIGFTTEDAPDGLDVTVPDFRRADITREADLIEEVARLDGVDTLPATLPSSRNTERGLTPRQQQFRRAADALTAQGLHEIIGWSFTSPELAHKLHLPDGDPALTLANPMSSEQSELRTGLLGSLLDVAQRNRARGAGRIALFESGRVYQHRTARNVTADNLPQEPHRIAALLAGPVRLSTWREQTPINADFFAAKGVLAGLFSSLGIGWEVGERMSGFLHPGRSAQVLVDGQSVGWLGEIHPRVAANWDFEDTVAAFEIELSALPLPGVPKFEDLGSFPEVHEDLAVLLPERVTAAELVAVITSAGRPLLADAHIFDVYHDAQRLGEGNKSVAVRLNYRATDRTLTDTEVSAQRQRIINALQEQLDGKIRTGE